MNVRPITTSESLAPLEVGWNALADGMPLRSWDWLATWWKHYGAKEGSDRQLYVLAVHRGPAAGTAVQAGNGAADGGASDLIGIAPWYLDRTVVRGSVLRWLGSGEVCSDHLSLICRPGDRAAVAATIADALTTRLDDWDRLELSAVDAPDVGITALLAELEQRDCLVSRQPADACWILDLPASWDDYLASLSKSHRKQVRQLERRVLESDRVAWHRVQSANDLAETWPVLVELHQRRRRSLGEPGCFASRPFHDFHREVAGRLLERGQLRMSWLELDGKPAAAEYQFVGRTIASAGNDQRDGHECPCYTNVTYAYQGGVDPDRLSDEPGRLSIILSLRAAIEAGHRQFDFLRGDEPYKAHWRATPHAAYDYRVVPKRRLARLRGRVLALTDTVSDWAKQRARMFVD